MVNNEPKYGYFTSWSMVKSTEGSYNPQGYEPLEDDHSSSKPAYHYPKNKLPSGKLTWQWKITSFNGKPNVNGSFSIAMFVYQRVTCRMINWYQLSCTGAAPSVNQSKWSNGPHRAKANHMEPVHSPSRLILGGRPYQKCLPWGTWALQSL